MPACEELPPKQQDRQPEDIGHLPFAEAGDRVFYQARVPGIDYTSFNAE